MKRKGQTQIAALVELGLYAVIIIAAVLFLRELQTLFQVIIGNIFYLSLVLVTGIGGVMILYNLVQQDRLSFSQAGLAFTGLIALTLIVPAAGVQIGDFFTGAEVPVTVKVSQAPLGDHPPSFDRVSVGEVTESGPQIFSIRRQACVYNCGDWEINVKSTCGDTTKEVTFTGTGSQTKTKSIAMPTGKQCTLTAEMVRPSNNLGSDPYTAFYTTNVG